MQNKYYKLLRAILDNAENIKLASVCLFNESLNKKDSEEKLSFCAYGQNMLFACLDEIGKFYLIKSYYPKPFNNLSLKGIGFTEHKNKINELLKIIRRKDLYDRTMIDLLMKFKHSTLYVDYKDGKIVMPHESNTLNKQSFIGYVNLVAMFEKIARNDLDSFDQIGTK